METEKEYGYLSDDDSDLYVKRKTLVSPWENVEEFSQVYNWIYGVNATNESKQLACQQMTVWKLRRQHLTPASILGTLVILEAQLRDRDCTVGQQRDLQIIYSSAFTRFFNYMSSVMQAQNMRTMYETAKQLNLRSFVVDLRHICAHGQTMPSLDVLRGTAKYCIKWLEEFYWRPQNSSMRNVDVKDLRHNDPSKFGNSVMKLFQYYDSVLECALKRELKITRRIIEGSRFSAISLYFEQKGISELGPILNEIVKDLSNLFKMERNRRDVGDFFIEGFMHMKFFFVLVETHLDSDELIVVLIRFTKELFRMLAVTGLLEEVFLRLLATVENKNEDSMLRHGAGFWAHQVVRGYVANRKCMDIYRQEKNANVKTPCDLNSLNSEATSKVLKQFLVRAGVDMDRTLIFGGTVRRPLTTTFSRDFVKQRALLVNKYSLDVLLSLLQLVEPPLPDEDVTSLTELMKLKVQNDAAKCEGASKLTDQPVEDGIHTAEDVIMSTSENGDTIPVETSSTSNACTDGVRKYGIWSTLPDSEDWCKCPIGTLLID